MRLWPMSAVFFNNLSTISSSFGVGGVVEVLLVDRHLSVVDVGDPDETLELLFNAGVEDVGDK